MNTRSTAQRRALVAAAGLGSGILAREVVQRLREADLRGQVALVTGGSRGLGFLLARELAREGCRVAICARDQLELDRAQADLEAEGAEVYTAVCDIAEQTQVAGMIADVAANFGPIEILVNNAGVIQVGPYEVMTVQDYELCMDTMFWGVVYPTLAVVPEMRQRGAGRIVNITSIGGRISVPHLLPYSSAKFAAVGFSEGLRAELARDNITVTTIAPGLMRTGSHLNAYAKGRQESEYALFSLLASVPGFSMDAERAARQIVRAMRRGEADRVLSIPATLAARLHGLLPGFTADLLGVVNRILPSPGGAGTARARGAEIQQRLDSPAFEALTTWGRKAAQRFHQLPGPSQAPGGRSGRRT